MRKKHNKNRKRVPYNLPLDDTNFTYKMWVVLKTWCFNNDITIQEFIRDAVIDACYNLGITKEFYED